MVSDKKCPKCGEVVHVFRNPVPTVDILVIVPGTNGAKPGVVLIERNNPPYGWAIPGGFVDYGESVEQAAIRELKEETSLDGVLTGLLGVYSDPARDARMHTLSVAFTASVSNIEELSAGDDAGNARIFPLNELPEMAFDHALILNDLKRRLDFPAGTHKESV